MAFLVEDIGIDACREYWASYEHDLPDEDLSSKLATVDWEQPVLLYVGALTASKGIHSLITALPQLRSHQPNAQLIVVGSGTYREALEAAVHAISEGNLELLRFEDGDLDSEERSFVIQHVPEASRGRAAERAV